MTYTTMYAVYRNEQTDVGHGVVVKKIGALYETLSDAVHQARRENPGTYVVEIVVEVSHG